MTTVWEPFLVFPVLDGPADPSSISPNFKTNRVYTNDGGSPNSRIFVNDLTTGAAISNTLLSAICTTSNNTFVNIPAMCIGTDGNLYAMTSQGTIGSVQLANSKLSKINPATMLETSTLVPYAITHHATYGITNAGSFRICPFKLAGVDYLAILANGNSPGNIEIVNLDTMTSVITYDYTGAGTETHIVAGEQPTGTSQKLYLMEEQAGGIQLNTQFVATTFATTPSISDSVIGVVTSTDIDPAWPLFPLLDFITPFGLYFSPNDNSLVWVMLYTSGMIGSNTFSGRLVKINNSAVVQWSIEFTTNVFGGTAAAAREGQAAEYSDLSSGVLLFPNPNAPQYLTVTLSTGAFTTTNNAHFDGPIPSPPPQNGVRWPSLWNGPKNTLLYFYEGSNDISPAWDGGWALFGVTSLTTQPIYPIRTPLPRPRPVGIMFLRKDCAPPCKP